MEDRMKAVLWTEYGAPELLKIGEVKKPVPDDDELLIRVHAATVTPGDCEIRRFEMHVLFWLPLRIYFGLFKPKRPILGMEVAGEVEEVGKNVKRFKKGDQIISDTGLKFGAYAEYICLNTKYTMALKPVNISYEEAACIPTAGLNALHYIRLADLKPGQKILIKGAAGCFGTYAVQLAKLRGAEVTGVDSAEKLEILSELGADHTIDYTREDFAKKEEKYDVIFDVVGNSSIGQGMKSLRSGGRYILATPWVIRVLQGIWSSITSKKKFIFSLAKYRTEDLVHLKELVESGKLRPIIDKTYPMEQMIEAHKYVEGGSKIGNVAISVNGHNLFQ